MLIPCVRAVCQQKATGTFWQTVWNTWFSSQNRDMVNVDFKNWQPFFEMYHFCQHKNVHYPSEMFRLGQFFQNQFRRILTRVCVGTDAETDIKQLFGLLSAPMDSLKDCYKILGNWKIKLSRKVTTTPSPLLRVSVLLSRK